MKIKFKETTIAGKAIRKKGSTHEIADEVGKHIVERGFGEEVKTAAAPEPEPENPESGKKDKKDKK